MTEINKKSRGKSPYEDLLKHEEIRNLRNLLGIEGEQYIKQQILAKKPIETIMLLCPAYPHNGKKFTYEKDQLLGWRSFTNGTTF